MDAKKGIEGWEGIVWREGWVGDGFDGWWIGVDCGVGAHLLWVVRGRGW